jgi:hypothetical protein
MTLDLSKVKVTKAEAQSLTERMSNWDKLHADLKKHPPTLDLLAKMIKVETSGKKRLILSTRLLGIYNGEARRANEKVLRQALRG